MITSTIGRKFLKVFNERNSTNYNAFSFFTEIYFPIFFNHQKYAQWITNSPFVQGLKKGKPPSEAERKEKLNILIEKLSQNEPDASCAIGFPSLDPTATTSGQITNMQLPLEQEDAYFSWIGSGLGVGIEGGLSILFDDENILLDIFSGWKLYRENLNTLEKLRGNQISTWNGRWLAHKYDQRAYIESAPMAHFDPFKAENNGILELKTETWVRVLIGIAKTFPKDQLIGYVYSLGQTNTTIGFIPFSLSQIRRPIELYKQIFGLVEYVESQKQIEGFFGTAFGFNKACQQGSIGVEALEPKGLKEFIEPKKEFSTSKLSYNEKKCN